MTGRSTLHQLALMFFLRLFGSPSIATEEGTLLGGSATHRHRLGLLTLLALARGGCLSRDKLMAYLWPERDSTHARQLLNQAVYSLRKALGMEVILSTGEDLRLNTHQIRVDALEFESALESGQSAAAVGLYSGPLLDGFFLSDASEFEQWLDRERERLAARYAGALEDLARAAEAERDLDGAVQWWRERSALDRYDSGVAMALMRALNASGNRAGALQHAAAHERLIADEFGMEAPPELRTMAQRLRLNSGPMTEVEVPGGNEAVDGSGGSMPGESSAYRAEEARVLAERSSSPTANRSSAEAPSSQDSGDTPPPQGSGDPPSPPGATVSPGWGRSSRGSVGYGIATLLLAALIFGLSRMVAGSDGSSTAEASNPSIAVLPLTNLGTDPDDNALADRVTEELIAILAQADGLRVISSTSAFGFRSREIDVRSIADSLGVTNIVEGGLQRNGSRLRVRVRLVDGSDGMTRWSETFDREIDDMFEVQDGIVRAIAGELGLRLGTGGDGELRRRPTRSIAAYELYVRGSDPRLLRSDSAAREGLEHFRRAISLDSTYAAAYAGMARMYHRVAGEAPRADRDRYFDLAEKAALKAVALDETLAEAQATLGLIEMTSFDFGPAERHLRRAIALDPARAQTHEWMVTLDLWSGRAPEALVHAELALEHDPLSPTAHAEAARALAFDDRCDEALARLQQLATLQPPLLRAAPLAAQCHAHKQMWAEAIALLRPQAERGGQTALAQLGYMLARSGLRDEASRIQERLLEHWESGEGSAFGIAMVHAGFRDFDQAFVWLDRSLLDRSLVGAPGDPAHLMIMGPLMADLRLDPRFERLRKRLGLGSGDRV